MPQLDKLIFFLENIGFLLSFFGLVFYNQYIFYPSLLKKMYIRKIMINNKNISLIINFYTTLKQLKITFSIKDLNNLKQIVSGIYKFIFNRLFLWLHIKIKRIKFLIKEMRTRFLKAFIKIRILHRMYTPDPDEAMNEERLQRKIEFLQTIDYQKLYENRK